MPKNKKSLDRSAKKSVSPLFILLSIFVFLTLIKLFWENPSFLNIFPNHKPLPQVNGIANTPYVSAHETRLYLNGKTFNFTGVNAYSLASLNGSNAGCGGQVNGIEDFFSNLRPNSVVRLWAFQGSMATNVKTKQIDWEPLDRVVNTAAAHGQKLILVFGGQDGTCDDGHWKDEVWYKEGYTHSFNDDKRGLAPLPYIDYVKLIVDRYKNSTTIAMWELVSEPESSNCDGDFIGNGCYGHQVCQDEKAATTALRNFYDIVGGIVKSIDSNHLIESGVIGTGQCGAIFEDYTYIHQSPNIDVASYHDYDSDNSPMPGDEWNGLQKRLNQMKNINKPIIIGEVGMLAFQSPQCLSLNTRTDKIKAKMDAQFGAGIVGYLPWDWTGGESPICNYDIGNHDPLMTLLHDYPLL